MSSPLSAPSPASPAKPLHTLIIGGGFGGIGMAIKLKQAGINDFALLEKSADVGGYCQCSLHPKQDEYAKTDAGNRLWWRAERRRLDAEALRDSLLLAGGNLKLDRIGGPSFSPEIPPDALEGLSTKSAAWKASPAAEQGRRSVYIFAKRGLLPPLLTTFDLPDTTLPNCQRDVTTVPTQSLALLNNPFVHEQSAALASRIGTKLEPKEQVVRAWRFALGRDPRESEMKAALAHLEKQSKSFTKRPDPALDALASLCHVLLNTNEFMYVD